MRTFLPALAIIAMAGCHHRRPERPLPATDPTVTADDIRHQPGLTIEQLLLTKVPGLMITRAADGHLVLHLRGNATVLGEKEPLVVVNGIALGPNDNNLSAINPYDVESITVLRDAASTAFYGSRGTNGVILIKTRQS
jgi:iron complex outermembrane receptor protein